MDLSKMEFIVQGSVTVDAYFPNGLWYDLYNGTLLNTLGEEFLVLDAPLSTINVHQRGGSIIPRLPPAVTTNEMYVTVDAQADTIIMIMRKNGLS